MRMSIFLAERAEIESSFPPFAFDLQPARFIRAEPHNSIALGDRMYSCMGWIPTFENNFGLTDERVHVVAR